MRVAVNIEVDPPRWVRSRRKRLLALSLSIALLIPAVTLAGADLFTDVNSTNPFYKNIQALALSGVTAGCSTTTYCPTGNVTREQMAAFLQRGLGRVALADLTQKNLPTSETPAAWTFTIRPGIPNGAVAGAAQFIKTDASITLHLTDATGCPCIFRTNIYVTGFGYQNERVVDVSLSAVGEYANVSITGAIAVTGSATKTVEVRSWRLSGGGTANAYGTATAEMYPFGSMGTNVLSAVPYNPAGDPTKP